MFTGLLLALLSSAGEPVSVSGAKSTPEDPVTCRRFAETGSHVRKVKVCRTRSEWTKVAEAARQQGRSMVDDNRSRPGSN